MAKNESSQNTPDPKHASQTVCGSEPTTEITTDEIESFGRGNVPRDTHVRAGDKSKRKPAN